MSKATAVIEGAISVTFVLNPNGNPSGSSLWFELPTTTNRRVSSVFGAGAGLPGQDKMKYSERTLIKSLLTNNEYSLYKCYGVWRVGALKTSVQDEQALRQLLS